MSFFIGLDLGTSGAKAVLFDDKGEIHKTSYSEYPLFQPHNGWAQQKPLDWKNACFKILKDIGEYANPNEIKGIGVSGQMHGLVLLDKENNVLCDSIIWCDQRTEKEVEEICRVIGKEKYIELTYNAPNTSFTLSKLLWVKNNMPEIYAGVDKILLPKDYINFCLTAKFATDVSDASGTGYFSVKSRTWCDEILRAFDIEKSLLPTVYESCEKIGCLSQDACALCGLTQGTVVAAGAGDQAAAALGNGVNRENLMSISLGTSGVVFSAVNSPIYDTLGRTHTFCHSVPGLWHVMGVTQGCGLSVSWFKHNFADNKTYKELDAAAESIGSDGVIFLPYLMGERTPHLDPNCRGIFAGLSASHTSANLYRAVLEGVCMSLNDCCEIMKAIGLEAEKVSACGGGANSKIWLKILADVLSKNICTGNDAESGALGAAILAAVACGEADGVMSACSAMTQDADSLTDFNEQDHEKYSKIFKTYRALYKASKLQ